MESGSEFHRVERAPADCAPRFVVRLVDTRYLLAMRPDQK
jgi:hypothetical protein